MSEQLPRSGFTDVDKATVPEEHIQLLDNQQRMAFVQLYKQRARTLLDLQPGQHVLDAGAGTGDDAQAIAKLVAPYRTGGRPGSQSGNGGCCATA